MAEHWDLDRLTREWAARGLSRRHLMRLVAGGASTTALLAMLGPHPGRVAAQEMQVSVAWRKPSTLNPLFSTSGNEQQVERLIFGSLVKMSADLVPTPDLSESIDVSEDAKVYTFKLKPGITFTDGQPLTSKDVAFTLERAIDKRTGSYWQGRLIGIEGAEAYGDQQADSISGLATPDDLTVRITLSAPDAAFLLTLCNFSGLGILPRHVLGDVAPDQLQAHEFSLNPTVTAGAYKFVRYETDQFLELAANPDYVGGAPAIERLFLRILTPDVALAQIETGELDLTTLPASEAERIRTLSNVVVSSVPSPSIDFLVINMTPPYLQNKQMRQAMMYAIDREAIIKQVWRGEGEVVNSPIVGPEWMGTPEGLNPYPYDPEKAKEVLASSGFDTSQTLKLMHLPGDSKEGDAAVVIIQEQLRQAGFKVDVLQVDLAEFLRRYIDDNDFDLTYNGGGVFRADPSISGTYFLTRNFTPNGGNGSHYSNPQVDELYAQGRATNDPAERKRIYTELAKILNDELPWIYLWSQNSLYAASKRLQGFVPPSYTDNKFWNAETWTVTAE
ncbi:MAG: peptide/nickel transport system substrate-binding protein [Thermomicrobiales bacterium]|nr:peptide/nickel transport system substrate-binding protein [Thermomicrobiales bacterium]